jgi:hypothetical protein
MSQPRLMFYHDGRHPLIYMYEPPMQKTEYEMAVDELVGTPVDALMFCLGDGRTVLHDTQVGELWGHNVKRWPHLVFMRAWRNAQALIRQGHDPLRIVCQRAHAKGIKVYPTLLVQQGRGPRGEDVRCADFRFDHPHLEIGAKAGVDEDFPGFTCLDFMHKKVRDERFALIAETLDNYPVDGFELQLNYTPIYFHPDEVDQGRQVMSEWVARVSRKVKKSGKGRELVVRVPASIEGCWEVGMDVVGWIEQGLVDVVVAQTFSGPELLCPTVDFKPLVKAAQGHNCRIHAAIQSHVDSDRLGDANIEMIRATACNYWDQGVDGLYLPHWFNNWPYQASFYEKLREMLHPEIMAPKDKFYYVPTETGRYPKPPMEPGMTMELPAGLEKGKPVQVEFQVSDDLRHWAKAGRVHEVLFRVRIMNWTERDKAVFRLNGKELAVDTARLINETYKMHAPRYRTGSGYWFIFRLEPKHWPKRGSNKLEIAVLKRDAQAVPDLYVRDVELETKYLMGKNYHRGQDADLGAYEMGGI